MEVTADILRCEIEHHFAPGVYAKQVTIPAGSVLTQHRHTFDHMSILASGKVTVQLGSRRREYVAPAVINIPAGLNHTVCSHTESVWFCIHHTDEVDPDKIDMELVVKE